MSPQNEAELTTTLRLGAMSDISPAANTLFEGHLSEISGAERAIIDEIRAGSCEKAMLVIFKGPSKGSRFLITTTGATIGRAHESEIFLDDVTVSRAHASVTFAAGARSFSITDSASLNGTYLNSTGVSHETLSNGDEIQIGKFHLIFIVGQK
jgi:pSer/pThr/pTyr-binding forkhead associated (FHA) protein